MSSEVQAAAGTAGASAAGGKAPRHLWDYWRIIWEGRRILFTVAGITLAVAILGTLIMPRRYKSEALVNIELSQAVVLGSITERASARSFFDVDREFKTEFVKIRTRDLLRKALKDHDILAKVPDLARLKEPEEVLKRCLLIERVGQTSVASIGVSWGDAKEAALLANAVAETYVANDLDERVAEIDNRIDRLKGSLGEKTSARRQVIEHELAIIRSDRDIDELLTLSLLRDRPSLQKLSEDLKAARSELASVRGVYGPAAPSYQAAASRVAEVKSQVDEAVAAAVKDLEGELVALGGDPTKIEPSDAPVTALQAQSNQDFEKDLQKRVTEEEIFKRTAQSKAHIIDSAQVPRKPYSPRWSLNLTLALVVGFGFGGGLIFFKDYLDQSVKTIDDVERDLGLPLLAVMPLLPEGAAPDKIAREAYQTLRTGLLFASGGRKDRVLLVTSSGPQEGKTTVVVNLAKSLATSGERVLVMDCDLRRASTSRALGGQKGKGLSSYLADGAMKSAKEIVSSVEPNLDLISSGPLPPNPVDLLVTPKFRELLQEMRNSYQWVILDSPPVSSVSDPVMLGSMAEMVLVVLRHDQTDKDVVRRALLRLSGVSARVVGAVLNGVDMSKAYNREYYYGRFFYGAYYGDEAPAGTEPPKGLAGLVAKLLK